MKDGKDIRTIYDLLSELFKKEPVTGNRIYEMLRSYGTALAKSTRHDLALNVFMDLVAAYPDDIRTYFNIGTCCEKLDDVESCIREYKKGLDLADHQNNIQRKKQFANILGRVYHKNFLLDEVADMVREAKQRNDYEVFFSLLSCHLDIDNDLKFMSLDAMIKEQVGKLNDFFILNNDNGVIPLAHLRWIKEVAITETVSKFAPGHVGRLDRSHSRRRVLKVFSKGLTPAEIYYALCHEVGHNVFSQLTDEQKKEWKKMARKFDLVSHYPEYLEETSASSREEEAFVDMYAAYILMQGYWSVQYDKSKEKAPDSMNVKVYEFIRPLFFGQEGTHERGFKLVFGEQYVDPRDEFPFDHLRGWDE